MSIRKKIFKTIQKEMIENIENATFKNLSEIQEKNNKLFGYAHYLNDVPNYVEPDEIIPEKPKENTENTGILERKLYHGVIKARNIDIFIPESIIRKQKYNDGDIIKFKLKDKNNKLYDYKRIQKSEQIKTDRQTFEHGLVEKHPITNKLYINESTNGNLLKNTLPELSTYTLTKQDESQFNIYAGAVVDLAWYESNLKDTIRIVWKHRD